VTTYRARWLLPIDTPSIHGGWVSIERGRIVGVGAGRPPEPADDLGDVVVLPALVNAHQHLELSWLEGQVPPAASMVDWIRQIIRLRTETPRGNAVRDAMQRAARSMRAAGTIAVGDISNTLASPPVFADLGFSGVVFHELLGFDLSSAAAAEAVTRGWEAVDAVRNQSDGPAVSVVAHSPYSCSAEFIKRIAMARRSAPLTIHLAESAEEIEFLHTGGGPFRSLLQDLGVWPDGWQPPQCDPVTYLDRLGYLQPGLLVVHCVHLRNGDLERLRDAGAILVTCPRSNEWVGAGIPPLARAYADDVPVAVGTDSLASVPTLNLFDEMAAMRRIAPEVTAASFLESATRVGAAALGLDDELGTIAPGKRAELLVVDVPSGVTDVEEYLVSGVPADRVRPLPVHTPRA
jgi:cytosine/adenosine deaminase-related metal-dependent hydrolase